jgi:hypothetical protein
MRTPTLDAIAGEGLRFSRAHPGCRDERRVMFCRSDGEGARLYDALNDPEQRRDLANDEPETVEKMFEEYVLTDAGGSLPNY